MPIDLGIDLGRQRKCLALTGQAGEKRLQLASQPRLIVLGRASQRRDQRDGKPRSEK
jgi:hypothetical protein